MKTSVVKITYVMEIITGKTGSTLTKVLSYFLRVMEMKSDLFLYLLQLVVI